jgi:hypothetical protein
MKRHVRSAALVALFLVAATLMTRAYMSGSHPSKPDNAVELPREKGLPVIVKVGLQFLEVTNVNDDEEAFEATLDLRLRWQDLRLAYPAAETPRGFKEALGDAAEARLADIWKPDVRLANQAGEPTARRRGLRVFPTGQVELMERVTARFASPMDMDRFPFDRQRLEVQVLCVADGIEEVSLESRRDDLEFSNEKVGLAAAGWQPGVVDVRTDRVPGWHGDSHARLRVHLQVMREAGASVGAIFIPLVASLLIPLLALWLNRIEEGEFQIEAFELTNVIVGGLFAVIALNFTVNAEHRSLGTGHNPVTWLFALNYLTLGVSLVANMALFRFNVVKRLWGRYVQDEVYGYLVWAVPLLVLATATAIVMAAMA